MKKSYILAIIWTLCFVLGTLIGVSYAYDNGMHMGVRKWRGTGNDVQILEHMQKMKGKPYYPTRGWKHDKMPKYSDPKYKNHKFLGRCAWRDWFDYERHEHPRNGVYHNDDTLMLMYSYCDENGVCWSIMIEDGGYPR